MEGMTIEESPLPASGGIECEVCHKVLPYKSMYERHLRKHTGERPYQVWTLCTNLFTVTKFPVEHKPKICSMEYYAKPRNSVSDQT